MASITSQRIWFSLEHNLITVLRAEKSHIAKLTQKASDGKHTRRLKKMHFEPEWYVYVKFDTEARTLESDICSAADGCELGNFSMAVSELIWRTDCIVD